MEGAWVPLVQTPLLTVYDDEKSPQRNAVEMVEYFVDQEQTTSIVESIFIVMASMLLAALLGVLFYWSYKKNIFLFISILSIITFMYALINVIYFAVKRNEMEAYAFKIYLGSSIVVSVMNLILIIYFYIKSSSSSSSSSPSSSTSSQSYAPAPQYESNNDHY